MKSIALCLSMALLAAPLASLAQTTTPNNYPTGSNPAPSRGAADQPVRAAKKAKKPATQIKPFSHVALGGGFSTMGGNMQAAINMNRHFNLRGTGNYFNYSINNISTNGFNIAGKANFATGGASLDYYPWANHGFRISPGAQLYNQNQITANAVVASGNSFTLNEVTYYSEAANPVAVNANLGLNTNKKAATLTMGWGNMIPRRGGHWSFPFELGAAFTGVPTVNVGLTGFACTTKAYALSNDPTNCVNMATNTTAQSNLNAQISTWKSDLDPAKVYPILSFGVTYSFRIR